MLPMGVVPPDAPDPADERRARVARLAFPLLELVPQPSVEDIGAFSFTEVTEGADEAGPWMQSVAITSLLWRHPEDHADPRNLADLDEATLASLDEEPPWPRPAWLVAAAQRMRHRQLTEAVRTTWHRDVGAESAALTQQLVEHANHVLRNGFSKQLGLPPGPTVDRSWQVTSTGARATRVMVDETATDAVEIDTDPWVYAVGVRVAPQVVTTVVIDREDLSFIRLALRTRPRR